MKGIHISTGPRRVARLCAGIIAVTTLALLPSAAPVAAGGTVSYDLDGHTTVSGAPRPYRLGIHAQDGSFAAIQLWFTRRATSGNKVLQEHEYFIDETQMTCAASLASCHLKDAGSLESLGKIDLDFTPTAAAKTRQDLCWDGTTSVGTIKTRKGVLKGTFRLDTGTDYFGSIRNNGMGVHVPTAIPITARRYVSNGNSCPDQPSGPCVSGMGVFMSNPPKFAVASKDSLDSKAIFQVGWQPDTGHPKVDLQHTIFGYVPKSAIKVTSNVPDALHKMKVRFSELAPFVSGNATFYGVDPPEVDVGDCPSVSRQGTLDMDLTVHFDGFGTIHIGSGNASAGKAPA